MKMIPIDIQRKLMFIPSVNFINWLLCWINLRTLECSGKLMAKVSLLVIVYVLPVCLLGNVLLMFFLNGKAFISFATTYLSGIVMSYVVIRFQEKQDL